MKKCLPVCCVLMAVMLAMTALPCGAAEEYEPLRVFFHDVLTLKYEVLGGSGQYEEVSKSLTDSSGATVSPNDLKPDSYYYATVTVRDLVTGETASAKKGDQYNDPSKYWSCKRGYHSAYGSEDLGEPSENTAFANVEYQNITQIEHTVSRTTVYRCIYCSAYMFSENTSFVEPHRYDPDTGYCKCGQYDGSLVCTHINVNDDDTYVASYEIIDGDTHKEILYKNLVCEDCGTNLGSEFWKEQITAHYFPTGLYECKCGYRKVPECRHTRTTQVFVGTTYTPGETDTAIHWAEPNYKITCLDCGFVREETWPGLAEAHEYDENGNCICGIHITLECAHDRTEEVLVSTSYTPSETDAGMHWAVPNYRITCLDCGTVRDETGTRQQEPHAFDESGYCSACGFQKLPAEIPDSLEVTVSLWSRNVLVNEQVGADATVSGGSGFYLYHWEAISDTQKYIQTGPYNLSRSWAFNANSAGTWWIRVTVTDMVTGKTKTADTGAITVKEPCKHTGERLDYGKTQLEVTYELDVEKDILRHSVIYHETPFWTCADCMMEFAGETKTSLNRMEYHTFDAATNKCICGANRIENDNDHINNALRDMVEDNWDPYGKWTGTYERWDDLYHNYSLYVSDRVFGLEYAQVAADMVATVWMTADYLDQLDHEATKLVADIMGYDTSNMTYDAVVEKTRAAIASEVGYLAAGLTTEQVGIVANIISDSVAYAQEQAINEYNRMNDQWLDIIQALDVAAKDEKLSEAVIGQGSAWLNTNITNFLGQSPEHYQYMPENIQDTVALMITNQEAIVKYGNSSDEVVKNFEDMYKKNHEAAERFGDVLNALGVLVDTYNVTLQAMTIDTYTQAHIEYMENALASIGRDQLPLRTTLQTLINETKAQYRNEWASSFNADLPKWLGTTDVYLDQYVNLAYEEVIDICLGEAIENCPGVGLIALGFTTLDIFTGNKADDLLAYKKTYEIAKGSRDSLLSAIDSLSDPLTQSQLDALKPKIVFYASSCQTLSDAYNSVIQYDAKKGLPVSRSNYDSDGFIAEMSAYINLFIRSGDGRN